MALLIPLLSLLSDLNIVDVGGPINSSYVTSSQSNDVPVPKTTESTPSNPLGSVPGKQGVLGQDEDPVPKKQPSLFWKAMAMVYRTKMCGASSSLADDQQALFLGDPNQAGVPGGRAYANEVTNYQTFIKADAIQRLNHLSFPLDGDSYFEYLTLYLRNISDSSDKKEVIEKRAALLKAKVQKDLAWKRARDAYVEAKEFAREDQTPLPSFLDTMLGDKNYNAAWDLEVKCEEEYTLAQDEKMLVISKQLDQIKSADDRLTERKNSNMVCVAVSEDYIYNQFPSPDHPKRNYIDLKERYYRPRYTLPNLDLTCNEWQYAYTSGPETAKRDGPYSVSLIDAIDASWSDLGHEKLDGAEPHRLSDTQRNLLKKIQISVTFIGKPAIINVERGWWDVPNVRRDNPEVATTLPKFLRRPFCKTTKMMLAWGIEITFKLPSGPAEDFAVAENVSLNFLNVSPEAVPGQPNVWKFTAGCNTYPLLLAAVARVI